MVAFVSSGVAVRRSGSSAIGCCRRRPVLRCESEPVKVTREVVEKTAQLASLQLTPAEVERITPELQKIIGFVEQMNTLDVDDVEPTLRVEQMNNVLRDDEPEIFPLQEELLSEAPAVESEFVRVPQILKEED